MIPSSSAAAQRAIDISRHALKDQGKTPFGAIVVVDNEIVGEGTSSVIELFDPTAHAEVMALRHAGTKLEDFQLYRELTLPAEQRSLREDYAEDDLRSQAADVLRNGPTSFQRWLSPNTD